MVLADAEGSDAEPVGQHRLLDHLADDLGVAVEAAVGASGYRRMYRVRIPWVCSDQDVLRS